MRLKQLILLLALFSSASSFAVIGKEGGGGSQIELDFVQIARFASFGIEQSMANEDLFSGFDLASFNRAIGTVEIHQVDRLCTKEVYPGSDTRLRCLDAYYEPSMNKIQLSAENWDRKTCAEKMAIAVHEFGRASGNENGAYTYSSKVVFSKYILRQCIPYQSQLGIEPLSCNGKANYLEQSLHSKDSEDTTMPQAKNDYTNWLRQIVTEWNAGLGKGCPEEGKSACIRACFLKAGSDCFEICNGN